MRLRVVELRAGELGVTAVAFAYFLLLMCGWYVLRPIRDAMGVQYGVGKLPWLFTATFLVMLAAVPLFSQVVSRWPRPRVVPVVYRFFLVNLLGFWALFRFGAGGFWLAVCFFVWSSVYNLFVVSVFWSLMADLFRPEQGKRLFGFIAAGGSVGALAGPALVNLLVDTVGPTTLMLVGALLLEASVQCVKWLVAWPLAAPAGARPQETRVGGGPLDGLIHLFTSPYLLGIAAGTLIFTITSTILYTQQATIVAGAITDARARVALFARIDLGVGIVALAVQLLLTGRIFTRLGIAAAVAIVPILTGLGFVLIGVTPTLVVLVGVQGLRRALHFAVDRPAREVLFTVVTPEDKYKSKNVIDTLVYRGGDALSGWTWAGLLWLGLGAVGLTLVLVAIAGAWTYVMLRVAERYEHKSREASA